MEPEKQKRDYILPASILIAALMVAVALVYNTGKKNEDQNTNPAGSETAAPGNIDLSAVTFQGSSYASATLVEYGDYQCPYCGQFFEQTEPTLKSTYIDTGKVKFAFKDMAFLGPESVAAAEAASCAQDQGKFWEYHDALFTAKMKDYENSKGSENDGIFSRAFFISTAQSLGLNVADFTSCIDSNKYANKVQGETAEASAVMGKDKASTPSFFLDGQLLFQGALPFSSFQQAIDQVLAK